MRRAPADTKLPEKILSNGLKHESEVIGALRMRGLPFRATDEEVEAFFAGYDLMPNSIKYKLDE